MIFRPPACKQASRIITDLWHRSRISQLGQFDNQYRLRVLTHCRWEGPPSKSCTSAKINHPILRTRGEAHLHILTEDVVKTSEIEGETLARELTAPPSASTACPRRSGWNAVSRPEIGLHLGDLFHGTHWINLSKAHAERLLNGL
jgi:hypothetical protein